MKAWLNPVGIIALVAVIVFSMIGCGSLFEDEKDKGGSGSVNGVWYRADDWGSGEKTGTVITIKDGEGILTSVGDKKNSSTGNYLCDYANYVNRGLINIGDVVFRNIVYVGYEEKLLRHTWSYDIWYRDGNEIEYYGDDGGTPDWRNGRKLTYYTKENSSYPDTLRANYGDIFVEIGGSVICFGK
jgi:hypothetical protein